MARDFIYRLESGGYNTSRNSPGGFLKVEIAIQDSTSADWNSGLLEPDFAPSNVYDGEYVFSFGEVSRRSPFEAGLIELQSLDITADNEPMVPEIAVASGAITEGMIYKVIGYTTVTYDSVVYNTNDIFIGVNGVATYATSGSGTVNKALNIYNIIKVISRFDRTIHIRMYHKTTSGGSFAVKGHWILDDDTVAITRPENDTPRNWLVDFTCIDSIRQFEQRTLVDSIDDSLEHVDYDYIPTDTFMTFVGTTANTVIPGKYVLNQIFRNSPPRAFEDWVTPTNSRYFNLVEIFDAMSGYIGFAGSVNDGGTWTDFYSTRFYTNEADTFPAGSETLVAYPINQVYIQSAFFYSAAYDQYQTFFDRDKASPFSFFGGNSYLDMISDICISLGAFYRVRVNAGGERYLEIAELGLNDTSVINITDLGDIFSPTDSEPNAINISGVEIVPGHGENVIRGAQDSNSKKSATFFSVASFARENGRFLSKYNETPTPNNGGVLRVIDTEATTDFLSALWVSDDTPTGSRSSTPGTGLAIAELYSVCGMVPKDNGNIQSADPGNIPEYGEWRGGVGVFYPTTAVPWNTWSEVPGYALAHIMFNNVDFATDPVGYWRSRGEAFEVTVEGINADVFFPPFTITIVIDGITQTIFVQEIVENYYDNFTTYRGYTK